MTVYKIQNVNKHLLIQQIADLDNLLSDANDVAMMIILALNYLYSDTVQILQAQWFIKCERYSADIEITEKYTNYM